MASIYNNNAPIIHTDIHNNNINTPIHQISPYTITYPTITILYIIYDINT